MRIMEIGIGMEADSAQKKEVLNHNLYQTLPSLNSLGDLNKSNTNLEKVEERLVKGWEGTVLEKVRASYSTF